MASARKQKKDASSKEPQPPRRDWAETVTGIPDPANSPRGPDVERSGQLPDEDDDNPYQNSDEALPEDEEEVSLARDPGRAGNRFGES